MDPTLIALISTLVVSIVGNVAAWWQLANQAKKDKIQAELDKDRVELEKGKASTDKDAADRVAALAMIESQRIEIARYQTRGAELEKELIAKTSEIGELKLAAIDKEAEIRTMKYRMDDMQMRMSAMSGKSPAGETPLKASWKTSLFPPEMEEAIEQDRKNKATISKNTDMEIEKLRKNSILKRTD